MNLELPMDRASEWQHRARRAYEMGRLRGAALQACALAGILAAVSMGLFRHIPWIWLLAPFSLWTIVRWRGGALLWGGRFGLVAGALTLALPMSFLRPCCRPGMVMGPDCCAMPGACAAVGAVLGVSLAALLITRDARSRMEGALGMALGVLAVSVLKCPMLFAGEAFGLLGGLLGGVAVAGGVAAWWGRRSVQGA